MESGEGETKLTPTRLAWWAWLFSYFWLVPTNLGGLV